MTQEEIIKLAHTAGFNWPDIQATTIEQRLERFAALVAATEREKFTNTQEFVTLPREVVEQALKVLEYAANDVLTGRNAATELRAALEQPDHSEQSYMGCVTSDMHELAEWLNTMYEDSKEQIAALEQPQDHVPDAGNMVPDGWKLVPVEPTVEMLRAGCGSESPAMFRESLRRETDGQKTVEMVEKIIQRNLNSYRAMLAAAPQPQTTEQSSAVEQPQVEQEPVAGVVIRDGLPCLLQDRHIKSTDHRVYTHPQPKREPLENEQARRIYNSATYSASLAVFMTRIDAEHPDADDKGVSGWLQEAEDRVKHRTIDAAHEIK